MARPPSPSGVQGGPQSAQKSLILRVDRRGRKGGLAMTDLAAEKPEIRPGDTIDDEAYALTFLDLAELAFCAPA